MAMFLTGVMEGCGAESRTRKMWGPDAGKQMNCKSLQKTLSAVEGSLGKAYKILRFCDV